MLIDIEDRVIIVADYIIENRATVRSAAKEFGVSKSTIHADMTRRLEELDNIRYLKVREILEFNLSVRHLRGGDSTRKKYIIIE